ncbi:MAG: CopG family transcriptional regulator [Theionarchaea archaeon]|nr:CopG family transcriptional regulator [Theionarchaea archaeon]
MQESMGTTTISIDESVRDRLKRCRVENESFNSIIERLLDLYEEFDLEQYIEKQYQKLEKDKDKFISLEQYEAQRK